MYEDRNGTDIYYYYDSYGTPTAIRYYEPDGTTYRFVIGTNSLGDVNAIYNMSGELVVKYEYDAWGNIISETNATGGTPTSLAQYWSEINPFRYRGYYYDAETGLYYLQSRYYDAEVGRFISSDDHSVISATKNSLTDKNLYVYCDNNPVVREDITGRFWETALDVISLGASIVEVSINPTDPWAWAGLVRDAVDLLPFMTGAGEFTKAVKVMVKSVYKADDVVDAAKSIKHAVGGATGSYEVLYKSGKNYIGKGGFDRAITSAIDHAKPNKLNNFKGDTVTSIRWKSSRYDNDAFVDEYLMQKRAGGVLRSNENLLTYNKIWSPGKRFFYDRLK